MGIGDHAQSENYCWLWRDGLRGRKGRNPQQGMAIEKDWTVMEAGAIAESHTGGGATMVASFSPHAGTCRQQ